MTIAELCDWFAQDCIRAAGLIEEKKQREMLLKLAEEWLADARRSRDEASFQPTPQRIASRKL
jgi:hypothetical protein